VSAGGRRKPVICGLFAGTLHVAMVSGFSMIAVIMAFMVDMLRAAYRRFVNMHDAHGVIRISEARRSKAVVGEGERQGRHQHTKHVD
jgi:uncharacterized iron-regulated membrane protein